MRPWIRGLVGTLALLSVVTLSGVGDGLERWLTDQHWRWRATVKRQAFPPQVVVVAIDDRTVKAFGRLKYWSRERYAQLLGKLDRADAVGFDILFDEADREPAGDLAFAAAMRKHGRVALPFRRWTETRTFSAEDEKANTALLNRFPAIDRPELGVLPLTYAQSLQPPLPILVDAAAALGSVDVTADVDGVHRAPEILRRTPDGRILPQFALAVAAVAERSPLPEVMAPAPEMVRIGGQGVALADGFLLLQPIAKRGGGLLPGPGVHVPTHSFVDVLTGKVPAEELAGKVVLVGETATGTPDIRPSALDPGLRGVELNAEILGNLLLGAPASNWHPLAFWTLIGIALGGPLWLYSAFPARRAVWLTVAAAGICLVAMEAGFWFALMLPPWSPVLFGFLGSTVAMALPLLAEEEARRRKTRERFAMYVAPEVVEDIVDNPDQEIQAAERRRVSILFSDIRGFTTFAEAHPPEQVSRQMSEYHSEMVEAVFSARGVLDKFIGDAVMALFGPYLESDENLSAKAVVSALEMMRRLEILNERWDREGLPRFRIGIGIHSGDAIVGNFVTPKRTQFTAFGDAVNLAARL
ncbi:MAG: CHASE2 domain-containing protein, partial [Actinomycetota bacterium]